MVRRFGIHGDFWLLGGGGFTVGSPPVDIQSSSARLGVVTGVHKSKIAVSSARLGVVTGVHKSKIAVSSARLGVITF